MIPINWEYVNIMLELKHNNKKEVLSCIVGSGLVEAINFIRLLYLGESFWVYATYKVMCKRWPGDNG